MLHLHLYERAKGLCKHIPFSETVAEDGVTKICEIIYKKDTLSVVCSASSDSQKL